MTAAELIARLEAERRAPTAEELRALARTLAPDEQDHPGLSWLAGSIAAELEGLADARERAR